MQGNGGAVGAFLVNIVEGEGGGFKACSDVNLTEKQHNLRGVLSRLQK